MKKILAMSLAILIAFTLSACGGITITPADSGSGTQEETATPAVPTDTPVPDKVQSETPDPASQDEVPSGTIKPAQASASDTDGTKTPGKTIRSARPREQPRDKKMPFKKPILICLFRPFPITA